MAPKRMVRGQQTVTIMDAIQAQINERIYTIMSDQPDCCGKCGCRLELLEVKKIEGEEVFVSECLGCGQIVLLVEN